MGSCVCCRNDDTDWLMNEENGDKESSEQRHARRMVRKKAVIDAAIDAAGQTASAGPLPLIR